MNQEEFHLKQNIFTKLSVFFVHNFRITLLILVFTLLIGFFVFNSLLKREGFPPIEVPAVIVQANYFINNKQVFNQNVTEVLESNLKMVDDVQEIDSITNDNFATLLVLFPEGYDTSIAKDNIEKVISSITNLPEEVVINVREIKAASFDGRSDLIFSIVSDEISQKELQDRAYEISDRIQNLPEVQDSFVKEIFVERKNPLTGSTTIVQESINRVGRKNNDNLVFQDAVSIGVVKDPQVGTIDLSESIRDEINEISQEDSFKNIEFVFTADQADILNDQINSLGENAISGAIAVLIVVFLFINLRASIITAVFIPITLAATFITLYLIGYTLNVLVLFALILVLGLFVDDATVIVESIDYYKSKGYKGIAAIKKAINSVGVADVSGTVTTMLVFFPLATISGVLGDFIKVVPITVIVSLGLSLIIALTIVTLLSSWFLKGSSANTKQKPKIFSLLLSGFNYPVDYLGRRLENLITWYLKKPLIGFGIIFPLSLILIGVGGMFASRIGFQIFPESKDSAQMQININLDGQPDIEKIKQASEDIENIFINNDLSKYVLRYSVTQASQQSARIAVNLTEIGSRDLKAPELVEKINSSLSDINIANVKASVVNVGPPISEFPLKFQIYAENENILESASKEITNFIKSKSVTTKAKDISIIDTNVSGLTSIQKKDGKRYVEVSAKLSEGFDSSTLIGFQEILKNEYTEDKLKELKLDKDALGYDLGQESSNLESFNSAILALFVALAAMYILLVAQYNSFVQPLLIFVAIPFTFFILFPGLALTNNPMSFFVVIGLTGLIGIVVNNTIMLVEFVNQSIREGNGLIESISQSVRLRLRPILTTSTTTIAGLLPLALTDPFWEPLALTIVFGLISSVVMVLLFFGPYIYLVEVSRNIVKSKIRKLLRI